jgi:hypothetical protein
MRRRVALLAGASLSALVLTSSLVRADGYERRYAGPPLACTPGYIVESNNQVSADFKAMHFGYKEVDTTGAPLDTESGWVPGFGVSLSVMSSCTRDWLTNNLYINFQYSHFKGKTDYVGGPIGVPNSFGTIRTQDGAIVNDFDVRLGKGFAVRRDVMLTPFFGVGHHEWDRKVNAGEDYTNGYYGAGLLLQWSPFSRFVLSADGLVGRTFDASVLVEANPGLNPTTKLDLGASTLYKVGLSGDYALARDFHVNAGVEWIGFDYGISPAVNGILEPDSRTRNVTFRIGAGYAFGGGRDYAPLK